MNKARMMQEQVAFVEPKTLSDGSKAYDVVVFASNDDSHSPPIMTVGAVTEDNANAIAEAINAAAWVVGA